MYLIENGFYFDKFWVPHPTKKSAKFYPGYPKSLDEARVFVSRYREYGTPFSLHKQSDHKTGR